MVQNQSLDVGGATTDWRKADTQDLIEYIIERFHSHHRKQLPELILLAQKVESVHADHTQCPHGIASHLVKMEQELLSHMFKEEQILFPMLMKGMYQQAEGPASVMETEHNQHLEALEELTSLTNQLVIPEAACTSWNKLYRGLSELQNDLIEHINLENNILFKKGSNTPSVCCGKCGGA